MDGLIRQLRAEVAAGGGPSPSSYRGGQRSPPQVTGDLVMSREEYIVRAKTVCISMFHHILYRETSSHPVLTGDRVVMMMERGVVMDVMAAVMVTGMRGGGVVVEIWVGGVIVLGGLMTDEAVEAPLGHEAEIEGQGVHLLGDEGVPDPLLLLPLARGRQ